MRLRIDVDPQAEEEIVIRCRKVDERIHRIQRYLGEEIAAGRRLVFFKQDEEFYFPLDDVLFFETEGERVYAHTAHDAFRVKQRLYELEELLPRQFVRIAKGTILNVRQVYSLQRDLASASMVQFHNSHKQAFVSRHYYKALRQRLDERS